MSWSKPEVTSWGGLKSEKEGYGELYSKKTDNGEIDRNNHVHFHKDGVTITKDGKKSDIPHKTEWLKLLKRSRRLSVGGFIYLLPKSSSNLTISSSSR